MFLRPVVIVVFQADKLLSPEFQPVLEQLVNHCARKRQICLFSATFPVTVKDFKDRHITNPYEINLMDELTLKARLCIFEKKTNKKKQMRIPWSSWGQTKL